jgi:hypothetical protein
MKTTIHCAALVALMTIVSGCLPGADAGAGRYEIQMVQMTESVWGAIRWDRDSGKAWQAAGDRWVAIGEATPPPLSTYAVRMIGLASDWGAVRFDVHSGRAWRVVDNSWAEIEE